MDGVRIHGPRLPDAYTGWQQVSVYGGVDSGLAFAVGDEYSAFYELPGTNLRGELLFAVVAYGTVRGQSGPLTLDDLMAAEDVSYGVDEISRVYRATADGEVALDNAAGPATPRAFDNIHAANWEAKRLALTDYSRNFEISNNTEGGA